MGGKRRQFGRIRQLPSKRWQARYTGPDGLVRSAPTTFPTRADASAWLAAMETAIARGTWLDPDAGRVPLGDYVAKWIAERPGLAPRTVGKHEDLLRLHIRPVLGSVDLVDVTPARVRAWRAGLLEAGTGPPTVVAAYRLLRAAMTTAVDDELVRRNPCRIPGAGHGDTPERPIATVDEVFAIADAVAPHFRALILLAAFGGLRWGEVTGLRRRHVDIAAATVRVQVGVVAVRRRGLVEQAPKSRAGRRSVARRTVALPPPIMPELAAHLDQFAQPGRDGLVFVGPRGGRLWRSNFQPMWDAALTETGVRDDLHFHDLRHTGNTLAASSGASLRELMAHMGHSSPRAALIYQHATKRGERAIGDFLGGLIERRTNGGGGTRSGTPTEPDGARGGHAGS
jgi:integrase